MDKIYLSNCHINCAQGNLFQTVEAIKNQDIKNSSQTLSTDKDDIVIPYFLLEEEIQEEQESIYQALKSIISKVVVNLDANQRKSTALIIGTSLIDMYIVDSIENSVYEGKKREYTSKKHSIDSYAKRLASEFELNDFTMTVSTACTSSANALLEGANLLKSKIFDYVVVIGVEIFSQMMSSGFSSMSLLSPDIQRPFDKNRDGLILGEAIAAAVISKEISPWSLEGGFTNSNSLTITSVSQSGEEYVEVIQNALKGAGLRTKDITALKTHATGTYTNDLAEINAISKVFDKDVVFTALKPYIGHTLGACGILELALFMAAIDDGFIPRTLNHTDSIIEEYVPLNRHTECKSGIFMLNYFGFGGNNTSLIIKKELV